ncbi:ficolin-3-like [Patiria miniata]|uniref:Fibrinogen C-terminal domain-containing protein n=1 Tax=Patiria miniata TaxID=46514 RepID=A0A914A4S6_PATMI|nr:ficolin-3-like [Patiria miniata]
MTVLGLVNGFQGDHCGNRKHIFIAAENRALQTSTLREEQVKSAVRCVSYCHADNNCRSVNYHETDQLCQMNNLTRMQNPADFFTHYGSVYFDDDVHTSLFSVPQFRGCDEVLQAGHNVSGIYTIFTAGFNDGLQVYCDMETDGGGWIVIQRRQDGSVDFYRNWADYQVGFGSLSGEFWLGNDNLRSLTETEGKWQLRIDLEDWEDNTDWENNTAWAEYDDFQIHGDNYTLQVNSYNTHSTAGDSLTYHNGTMFSTKDKDNDTFKKKLCAKLRKVARSQASGFRDESSRGAVAGVFVAVAYSVGSRSSSLTVDALVRLGSGVDALGLASSKLSVV